MNKLGDIVQDSTSPVNGVSTWIKAYYFTNSFWFLFLSPLPFLRLHFILLPFFLSGLKFSFSPHTTLLLHCYFYCSYCPSTLHTVLSPHYMVLFLLLFFKFVSFSYSYLVSTLINFPFLFASHFYHYPSNLLFFSSTFFVALIFFSYSPRSLSFLCCASLLISPSCSVHKCLNQ